MEYVNQTIAGAVTASALLAAAWAIKPCDELKSEIAAKLDSKGITGYTLGVVANEASMKGQDVVGHCEGGTKILVYQP